MREFPDILPQRLPTTDNKFNIYDVKLGDGYSQRGKQGINNKETRWSLKFRNNYDDIETIKEFINDHEGHIAFSWAPPKEVAQAFICQAYQGPVEFAPGYYELKCTFIKVYDL